MIVKPSACSVFVFTTILAGRVPTQIYVAADAAPGGNGASWATALDSLTNALQAGSGSVIYLKEGVYRPYKGANPPQLATFLVPPRVQIYGGFVGTEGSPGARQGLASKTVLDGDVTQAGDPNLFARHVVTIDTTYAPGRTRLDRLTICNGNASGPFQDGERGGGIFFAAALLGDSQVGSGHSLDLIDLIVRDNRANFEGGGLYARGGSFQVYGCRFLDNMAAGSAMVPGGGGIKADNCGSGFRTSAVEDDMHSHIYNTRFSGNGTDGAGGGIGLSKFQSFVWPNYPRCILMNCVFDDNKAARGGGGYADYQMSADWLNCTFSENIADIGGGGLYLDMGAGGQMDGGQAKIVNSIIYGNFAPAEPEAYLRWMTGRRCEDTPQVLRNNDISTRFLDPNPPHQSSCPNKSVNFNRYLDPLFRDPLAGNYQLGAGSFFIDYGTTIYLPPDYFDADGNGNTVEPMPYDFLNQPRIYQVIDCGAFER